MENAREKPLQLEITLPDNSKHRGVFNKEFDYYDEEYNRDIDGEHEILISPTILGKKWDDGEEDEDLRISYTPDDLSEWIGLAILEGYSFEEEDPSVPGLSFKVLNREDFGEEDESSVFLFGEPENIQKAKSYDISILDPLLVSTNDLTTYEVIRKNFPQLASLRIDDFQLGNKELKAFREQSNTETVIKASILEQRVIHGYEPTISMAEVLKESYQDVPLFKSEGQKIIGNALNGSTSFSDVINKLSDESLPEIKSEFKEMALHLAKVVSIHVPSQDELIQNLPMVDPSARIEERELSLSTPDGIIQATGHYHVRDYSGAINKGEDLLAISVNNDDGSISLYNEPDIMTHLISNEPPKPSAKLDAGPNFSLDRKM